MIFFRTPPCLFHPPLQLSTQEHVNKFQGIYFFIYAQNPNLTPNWLLLLSLADEFLYYVLAYYALLFVKFSYLSRFHGFLVFVILYW